MATDSEGPDDGATDGGDENNPFRGTPFEELFKQGMAGLSGLGGLGGAGAPGQMPDLSQIFGQIQSLLQPYEGSLNWEVAGDLARKTVAQSPDPTPSATDQARVADAVQLADHWLDETTGFPSGVTTATAWSRAEWIVNTTEVWKVLVEPVAKQSVGAVGTALPEEAQAQAAPILGILGKAIGALLANQVGSGLGTLAGEVLSVSDIGIPLASPGRAALIPANISTFADGLDASEDDVLLYLALREAAHQRLFAGVPWLRDHVIEAVTDYAQGIEVNVESIQQRVEEQMRGIDPSVAGRPGSRCSRSWTAGCSNCRTPLPRRLRSLGSRSSSPWWRAGSTRWSARRRSSGCRARPSCRRPSGGDGPRVDRPSRPSRRWSGLELRPRRLRDASTLWGSLRTRQGIEARDGVWMHPGLLPTDADLDDPLGFREDAVAPKSLTEEDFDAGLRALLDGDETD